MIMKLLNSFPSLLLSSLFLDNNSKKRKQKLSNEIRKEKKKANTLEASKWEDVRVGAYAEKENAR